MINIKVYVCLVVSLVLIAGCGGRPSPPKMVNLTATQVQNASMVGQTWVFKDRYGDTMTIEVQPGGTPGSVVWHYTKDNARAYWSPSSEGAELWFELDIDPANNNGWYNTWGHIIWRGNCWWDYCKGPNETNYVNSADPGKPRPYLIVPSLGNNLTKTTLQTSFTDFGNPNTVWRTDSYVEEVTTPFYSGPALVSEQWEGPCVHEKWYFAPDRGLVEVIPLGYPDCTTPEAELTMKRIQ